MPQFAGDVVSFEHQKGRMDSSRNVKLAHPIAALSHAPLQTVDDALRLIDRNLPKERRHVPMWRRTRELLTKAARSRDPETIEQATHHFERAVREERGRN